MLAQPGQDIADVAAKVADEVGRPLARRPCSPGWRSRSSARARSPRAGQNGQSPIPLPGIPALNLFGKLTTS